AVEPGWEAAVATALGVTSDAVAVESVVDAVTALRLLRADDLVRAGLLICGSRYDADEWHQLPIGLRYVVDLCNQPSVLRPAPNNLLSGVVAVEDLATARALVEELPDLVAVTRDGDLLSRDRAYGGSANAPSLLEVQAAVDEAADQLAEAIGRAERIQREL